MAVCAAVSCAIVLFRFASGVVSVKYHSRYDCGLPFNVKLSVSVYTPDRLTPVIPACVCAPVTSSSPALTGDCTVIAITTWSGAGLAEREAVIEMVCGPGSPE